MDCLVNLYNIPRLKDNSTSNIIRRVMAYEKSQLLTWVEDNFSRAWADECSVAFSQHPISCYIATHEGNIVGFACYDCTQRNFFGPMGVQSAFRSKNIGNNLLFASLHQMKNNGFAYAIIGGCDGVENYYIKTVFATIIEKSSPGIYTDRLNP